MLISSFIVFVFVFVTNNFFAGADSLCGLNWVPYKTEKCFQLIQKVSNWQESKDLCHQIDQEYDSGLATIKSKDEDQFLSNYLFREIKLVDNVWIGARRADGNSVFKWLDNTTLSYKNWQNGQPVKDLTRNCVEIVADGDSAGQWLNIDCAKHNVYVLCQKTQSMDLSHLSALVLQMKKEFDVEKKVLQDTIGQMQTVENNLKNSLKNLKTKEEKLEKTVEELKNEIDSKSQNDNFPINAVYMQYPFESEPSKLWNCSGRWQDISGNYSDLFLRVNGAASSFGVVQEENFPGLDQVKYEDCRHRKCEKIVQASFQKGTWQEVMTGYDYYVSNIEYLSFHQKDGELRPRNIAVKIWKCVA